MDVTGLTATSAATGSRGVTAQLGGDFDTFLKMLTVQMRNQDPLNPIESTDYAVQLATFSGVEQQVQTNDLLAQLMRTLNSDIMAMTGWIGAEVQTQGPVFFDGSVQRLAVEPPVDADDAQMLVRDSSGRLVGKSQVKAQATDIAWTGLSSEGRPLPDGTYTVVVEYSKGGVVLAQSPVAAYAQVREIRLTETGPQLVLAGGRTISPGDILSLRQPVED